MPGSKNAKAELRKRLRQVRLEMLEEDRRRCSELIVSRLKKAMDWSKIASLHYFEPIDNLLEPDINNFITYLEDTYSKLRLATSRRIGDRWEIVGVHGGPPPAKFDAVLVPALGFDPETLHRIGYGGGFYDRFLATQPQARKIGVCFENGKVEGMPADPHDVALNTVVTEALIYNGR